MRETRAQTSEMLARVQRTELADKLLKAELTGLWARALRETPLATTPECRCRSIGLVPRNDSANPAFRPRREMLNRVFEIAETGRKGGLNFRFADRGNANQQLQLAEQGQRFGVAFQLAQDVIEIAKRE